MAQTKWVKTYTCDPCNRQVTMNAVEDNYPAGWVQIELLSKRIDVCHRCSIRPFLRVFELLEMKGMML